MPPFVRDDVPLVWYQEDQEDQDHYANEEPPIPEDNDLNLQLDAILIEVRASVQHSVDAERAGVGLGSLSERFAAYFNLLTEFKNKVDMKLALNQLPNTAQTALAHIALNARLNRLVREISEYYDRNLRE